MTFFLLSLSFSFSSFFLRHSFISVTLFSSFLLLSPEASPLCFFFFLFSFSLFFSFFLSLSLRLSVSSFFFYYVTLSLSLLFSPPRLLQLRSAVAMEFGLTIACKFGLFIFIFFIRCCWWMWVCAGGGYQCCCGSGCCWSLLRQWWLWICLIWDGF